MMNAPARTFEAKPAVRSSVPLLVGLMGPSGGGKTFSALRLATGIQKIAGGDIYGIDTEARRMLHYADRFKFKHIQFDAPFGSLDYLAAIRHCVAQGAGVIIIDSLSHEHDSIGGMLDFHDKELDRLAGDDYGKRERVKMLAWQKPKAARAAMINGILQLPANFIFCFRAKEKIKLVNKAVVPQGFMPIAGEELVFEMTVNCLLLPHADGVPTWRSDQIGERMMMKLPEQFRGIFQEEQPLSEAIGEKLAEWAKGGPAETVTPPSTRSTLLERAREKADAGIEVFDSWVKRLTPAQRDAVAEIMPELLFRTGSKPEAAAPSPVSSVDGDAFTFDTEKMRAYAKSISGAMSESGLHKMTAAFFDGEVPVDGTAAGNAVGAIFAIHKLRVAGQSSPVDADKAVADYLAGRS